MPSISDIPSKILYGSIFSEVLCITVCILRKNDSMPGAFDMVSRMMSENGNRDQH